MKKTIRSHIATATVFAGALFASASALASTATVLDLSEGFATFGKNYTTPTASFTDEYLFDIQSGTLANPAGTYTGGNSYIKGHLFANAEIENISWFKINDDLSRTALSGVFGGGTFGVDAALVAGHYGFDVTGHTLIANKGGNYSGTLSVEVTPVPEPGTYAMLAVGLGLLGFTARRKTNQKLG